MTIKDKFRDLKEDKRYSIPAKRLKEHLMPILSKSEVLKKRWMWELLQNASDLSDDIEAEFELSKERVIFRHNGPPFTLGEAYNLIMPDSDKDDNSEKSRSIIGQFGTGFISTHILSGYIEVQGMVEDGGYHSFAFALDRTERKNKDALIKSIIESEEEYEKSLKLQFLFEPGKSMDTQFIYHLDSAYDSIDAEDVVSTGLEFFEKAIAFVMAFRPQLSKVTIIDKRGIFETTISCFQEEEEIICPGFRVIKITRLKDKGRRNLTYVGLIEEKKTTLAFLMDKKKNDQWGFLPFPVNIPQLFCAFPMVGSEYFSFPVVIHSEYFVPGRERDGIELTILDTENRTLLLESQGGFKRLMQISAAQKMLDIFHICRLEVPSIHNPEVRRWLYSEIFKPMANSLYGAKIVELQGNQPARSSLEKMMIPYADKRLEKRNAVVLKVHKLAFALDPTFIPKEEHAIAWYEHLNFDFFGEEKLDFEKLVQIVSNECESLEDFCRNFSMDEDDAIEWLKELAGFFAEHDELKLFEKHPLIPDQNGVFKLLQKLYADNIFHDHLNEGYAEKLKDIFAAVKPDDDYRNFLIHQDFSTLNLLPDEEKELTLDDLTTELDNALRDFDREFLEEESLKILQQMFHWFAHCGLSDELLKKLFPWFSTNRSQLYMETQTPEQRDLAFTIVRSGKTEGLAALANSALTNEELIILAQNPKLLTRLFEWLNQKVQDNPDKELGDIGEEFVYKTLCDIFGKKNVEWTRAPEYDFKVFNADSIRSIRYYVDAKTTGKGIANSDFVPFFMRYRQWLFLEKEESKDKYLIARVFKSNGQCNVKFLNVLLEDSII